MTNFARKLDKALSEATSEPGLPQPPADSSWQDPGYEVALSDDGYGAMIDNHGNYAIKCWDALELTAHSSQGYGGELNTFQDITDYCQNAIEAMRANAIHGFKIAPHDNQDEYDFDPETTSAAEPLPYRDVGYDVPLNRDETGGVTDDHGLFVVWHWDVYAVKPNGSAEYCGDVNHFDELNDTIESIIDAMKSNLYHGFSIMPAHGQA